MAMNVFHLLKDEGPVGDGVSKPDRRHWRIRARLPKRGCAIGRSWAHGCVQKRWIRARSWKFWRRIVKDQAGAAPRTRLDRVPMPGLYCSVEHAYRSRSNRNVPAGAGAKGVVSFACQPA